MLTFIILFKLCVTDAISAFFSFASLSGTFPALVAWEALHVAKKETNRSVFKSLSFTLCLSKEESVLHFPGIRN